MASNRGDERMQNTLVTATESASGFSAGTATEIGGALRQLLADVFCLYLKTKNFHWHITGRHFRDYHLLLDERAGQIFAMTDDIAERARKLGVTALRSVGDIARHQRLGNSDRDNVSPLEMLTELLSDKRQLTAFLRSAHDLCGRHNDVATTSLIENWIDESERRSWFLAETVSGA
jgi:starvation-inducible DNA-binding protein